MFARMLIRKKILYSTLLLTITLLLLMYCSLRGVYAYRGVAINLRTLSKEIQQVWRLQEQVACLRDTLSETHVDTLGVSRKRSVQAVQLEFLAQLDFTRSEFEIHRARVHRQIIASDPLLATTHLELETIDGMLESLASIETDILSISSDPSQKIEKQLYELSSDLRLLFNFLIDRMDTFRDEIRARYRSWIAVIIFSALASLINVVISFWFFRHSVVHPFKVLLNGCRSIANGQFEHRIRLSSHDELAELAEAMNGMTARFVQIRNNLNEQVQERTQEVVRSEQLASVGFLAAGVAHEINNPLASIAWSAEALESRLHEILHPSDSDGKQPPAVQKVAFDAEQTEVLREYLKRIQDEAFRCKGITERLLDFSRLGEPQKKLETDIHEAVTDVCELVKHLGQYRNRKLSFKGTPGIYAWVSPTEFKQVILNLLTNALDASDDGGRVDVELEANQEHFTLRVSDYGCGMTEEVIKHLFEPFFTRRRDGRGTGLGLSITYRIVQDHGGTLVPTSQGPGCGSTMKLTMPMLPIDNENHERRQAA